MKNLKGGVAVVTGGASGLGRAIAEEAARRGMKLVIADVEAGAMEQAVADLRAGGAEARQSLTKRRDFRSVRIGFLLFRLRPRQTYSHMIVSWQNLGGMT